MSLTREISLWWWYRRPQSPSPQQRSTIRQIAMSKKSSWRAQESTKGTSASKWKNPWEQTHKKGKNSFICPTSFHHPAQHSSAPRWNSPAKKSSPHWEWERGVNKQLSQPFGEPHERPTTGSPHPETGKAESYREVQGQGRRAGVPSINHTAGTSLVPSDALSEDPNSSHHWKKTIVSTAATVPQLISPVFTTQVFKFKDTSHRIPIPLPPTCWRLGFTPAAHA